MLHLSCFGGKLRVNFMRLIQERRCGCLGIPIPNGSAGEIHVDIPHDVVQNTSSTSRPRYDAKSILPPSMSGGEGRRRLIQAAVQMDSRKNCGGQKQESSRACLGVVLSLRDC